MSNANHNNGTGLDGTQFIAGNCKIKGLNSKNRTNSHLTSTLELFADNFCDCSNPVCKNDLNKEMKALMKEKLNKGLIR